jgi:hypothetical protein
MEQSYAPGWYSDPSGRHQHRYFDGSTWSEHVSDNGIQALDPLDTAPSDAPITDSEGLIAEAELVEPEPENNYDEVADRSTGVGLGMDLVELDAEDAVELVVSATGAQTTEPGWYPDPVGRGELRYFDAEGWSVYIALEGETAVDSQGVEGIVEGTVPIRTERSKARRFGRTEADKAQRQISKAATAEIKDREKDRKRAVRDAKARLKQALRTREKALGEARKNLAAVEQARQVRINTARTKLQEAEDPHGHRVGAYQGIVLFERYLATPQGSGSTRGASATVDTAGNLSVTKRPTLTRMAAGGVLLGPLGAVGSLAFQKRKDVDARELYLMVETEEFAAVVKCPVDDGMKARQFAAAITTAGRQFGVNEDHRHQVIEWSRMEIAAGEADTAAIDAAQAELQHVETDQSLRAPIEATRAELDSLSTPPELGTGQSE